jgi:hypothetical protein
MADSQSLAKPATVDEVIASIEALCTEASSKLSIWCRPDWRAVLSGIDEKTDSCVDSLIAATIGTDEKASEAATKSSALIGVIKARRDKLALSSGSTDQIVGISQQILAFGAAGLALSVGFSDKIHTFSVPIQKLIVLAGILYVELVVLSLVVLVWYLLQTHFRYPFLYFRKIGNAWPFFYYASISHEVNRSPVQSRKERLRAGALYAEDFLKFSERCLNESPKQQLRAELQQYFLLMSYQGYVQQFALRFANLFIYGLVGATFSTPLIGAWSSLR